MKRLSVLFVTSLLIGSVNAADVSSTNGTVTTTSPAVTTATPTESPQVGSPTTGSMDASKPNPGAAAGVDATGKTQPGERSSGFTDNVRVYWNKFIDVFTGPPSKR